MGISYPSLRQVVSWNVWDRGDPAWRFALGAFIVARSWFLIWPFVISAIVPMAFQNLDLFGTRVVSAFDLASSERYVYSRQIDGAILTFRAGTPGSLTDVETGSVWSLRDGRAITGPYSGRTFGASLYTVEDVYPYHGVAVDPNPLIAVWQRFDANWYLAIAQHGYGANPGDTHFPPLFPALIRAIGWVLGGRDLVAGLLISQGALIASIAVLYRFAARMIDHPTARRVVVLTLLFPTAFFFFSAYTESLFLLFVLLCFQALDAEQLGWSGFWAFLAILTRLQGVALLAPLAWVALRPSRISLIARVSALGLPIGAGAFYLGLRAVVGDGNVLPTSEPQLYARLVPPWENFWYALQTLVSGSFVLADALNLLVTTLVIAVLIKGWRSLPATWCLYCLVTLLILMMRQVETQPLNSMSRYALTLFPITMLFAKWSVNVWVRRALVYVSFPLSLFLSAQFFMWGWVG